MFKRVYKHLKEYNWFNLNYEDFITYNNQHLKVMSEIRFFEFQKIEFLCYEKDLFCLVKIFK